MVQICHARAGCLFVFNFCEWDKLPKYAMLEQAICFVFFFCFLFVTGTNGPSKYAMLEQALLARSSEERVLTPFQVRVVF
jgi:hypothetical protein